MNRPYDKWQSTDIAQHTHGPWKRPVKVRRNALAGFPWGAFACLVIVGICMIVALRSAAGWL